MTFKFGRVSVQYDYGLRCEACDLDDSGFSNPEDAGAYVHRHNVEVHGTKCDKPDHEHKKRKP
jgi:hypothetical protein